MSEPTGDELQQQQPQPVRRKRYRFNDRRRAVYLDFLREGMRRGAAAVATGISRETVHHTIHNDPEFAAAVDRAELDACEPVEDALYQAAVSGNVHACEVWLYNRIPGKWADRRNVKQEVTGADGGPIPVRLIRVMSIGPRDTDAGAPSPPREAEGNAPAAS